MYIHFKLSYTKYISGVYPKLICILYPEAVAAEPDMAPFLLNHQQYLISSPGLVIIVTFFQGDPLHPSRLECPM